MKKAVRIVGIIFMILSIIGAVVLAIVGLCLIIGANNANFIANLYDEMRKTDPSMTLTVQDVALLVSGYGIGCLVACAFETVSAVLSGVTASKARADKEPGNRGGMIALGVCTIIFGALPVGILEIVYGATQGKVATPTNPQN